MPSPSTHTSARAWRTPRSRLSSRAGVSILELLIALAVMLGATLFYLRSMTDSISLSESNEETVLAADAMRDVIEQIRATDFADAFASYNATAKDDPGGEGTAPGCTFEVAGLRVRDDDADGFVGEILFPTSAWDPTVLTEEGNDDFPFLPRDLDLDGASNTADVTGTYVLLPCVVRLEWTGRSGDRELEFTTLLTDD